MERLEPAAFTIVMATGAFALATLDISRFYPLLAFPARALNLLNFIIFVLLIFFALCTWPFHSKEFREDLLSPAGAAFYAAFAIAFLVLGAQALRFGFGYWTGFALWAVGCVSTLAVSFAINFLFFARPAANLNLFTPVFFIPIGGLTVIPVGGVVLLRQSAGALRDALLMTNSLALGGGLLLYLGLFSLLLHRHYVGESLPHRLAPTLWIHMAPIGWGGVSLVGLADYLGKLNSAAQILAYLLWGACAWWFVMCFLLTIRAIRSGEMSFSLAWWAFIFPLGALVVLSNRLGASFRPAFYTLWLLMAAVWCVAALKTLFSFFRYLRHCSQKCE